MMVVVSIFTGVGRSLLSARASRLRDWGLFALAAIVPTVAVGALGLRALSSEEAAIMRQAMSEVEVEAGRAQQLIDGRIAEAESALEARSLPAIDRAEDLEAELRAIIPEFSDPIALRPDRRLAVPRSAPATASVRPGEPPGPSMDAAARKDCDDLALAYAGADDDAARADRRAAILAGCREARTESGRWLWPLVALDGLTAEQVPALAEWLDGHAARMRPPERAATLTEIDLAQAVPEADREALRERLGGSGRNTSIERLIEERTVVMAISDPTRSLVEWRSGGSAGVLRRREDGSLVGFVVHKASLHRALEQRFFAVSPDQRAAVRTGPVGDDKLDGFAFRARVTPELAIEYRMAARDFATRAGASRKILAGLAAGAMAIAFGVAALLFARMRAARRSSELRTGFVAAVSHELRTPIASMRMLSELLEQGRVEPEEQREIHEALVRESKRLGETVDRLLGFSRMAAGRATIDRTLCDVAEVVGASVDTYEDRHPDAPKVERELPIGVEASIDGGQIRLAVDNLLANAHKYAPKGTPYAVGVRRRAGGVEISVSDRGPGIARRDQKRIFLPFERADDRLSQATEGSGIGLSLVEQVARAHGGKVVLDSERGRGATFTIWIPAPDAAS